MKVEINKESFYIFYYILLEVIIRLQQFGVLVKHLEKICSVLEGTLCPSISFLENGRAIMPTPQQWDENIFLPLLSVISLYSQASGSTRVWFMINFSSCFIIGKAQGWGTFTKCRAGLDYCPILGLLFSECSHPKALPYTLFKNWQIWAIFPQKNLLCRLKSYFPG